MKKKLPVVIADDDPLVLKYLRELVNWGKLGFWIAATAPSGEQALKCVRKHHPFLLVTDIRMMGMNGLDLIEIVHREFPEMKFLIISSYDDFGYAKRAISSGVTDYLLKTEITAASLTEKLLETASAFQAEESINNVVYEQEFSQFLSSGQGELSKIQDFTHLRSLVKEKYYFSVISGSCLFSRDPSLSFQGSHNLLAQIKSTVYAIAKEYSARPLLCIDREFLILGMKTDRPIHEFHSHIAGRLVNSMPYVQFYYTQKQTISDFRALYFSLLPFLHYHIIFYPNAPMKIDSLKPLHYIHTGHPFPFHSLVFDEGHLEKDILLIKEYVTECCTNYDIYTLISFYRSFCTYLEINSNNQLLLPPDLHAPTKEILLKWLFNSLSDCIKLLAHGLEYRYCPPVDAAIRFMVQNYSNPDLSSYDISNNVGLSSNRLGILFKQETGKTINEYLNNIRVENAIALLEKTNMKIYEISEKCGFKTAQYFSQVIYTKTGRRPIDYRKVRRP